MNILDVEAKVTSGGYRSDRYPAVPFVTFSDMLTDAHDEAVLAHPPMDHAAAQAVLGAPFTTLQDLPQAGYPECGACLSIGPNRVYFCGLRLAHVEQHDWAALMDRQS